MEPTKVTKSYYIKGVKFDGGLEEYVSLRKHMPADQFNVETHVYQTNALNSPYATPEAEIRRVWAEVDAMDPKLAFQKYSSNAQQLMTVMSIMGPEKTLAAIGSKVFDKQTITKSQRKTFLKDEGLNFGAVKTEKSPSLASDIFETKEVTYVDTYIIHKIEKENFGPSSGLEQDVFVLEVECPSTHQHYFIFIDSTEPQCQDAIGAVAWTMVKDNGECLSKEEYMELQAEA